MSEKPDIENFPATAKPFYRGHRQWLADIDRHTLELLAMNLLLKREADGLNGRMWHASQHLYFEDLIAHQLPRRCPNDTDGDGDCHLCHGKGGCPNR